MGASPVWLGLLTESALFEICKVAVRRMVNIITRTENFFRLNRDMCAVRFTGSYRSDRIFTCKQCFPRLSIQNRSGLSRVSASLPCARSATNFPVTGPRLSPSIA